MSAKDTKKKASAAEPSAASLRALPPLENPVLIGRGKEGLARVKALAATRRGRPAKGETAEGTVAKSVRLPKHTYETLERLCAAQGISVHVAMRQALAGWIQAANTNAPPLLAGGLKRTNAQKTNKPQKARKSQTRR